MSDLVGNPEDRFSRVEARINHHNIKSSVHQPEETGFSRRANSSINNFAAS